MEGVSVPNNKLKLFVVNQTDGAAPDEWSEFRDTFMVIAKDKDQALELVGDLSNGMASEVAFDTPKVLLMASGSSRLP